MVDVINEIKDLLVFEDKEDFYYLQILQRKKENPKLGSNSRVIKNYYITSFDYLEKRYDEIKKLCEHFNARAMLRLNKRSFRKVAFKSMQNIANSMANGEYSFIKKSYDRACGLGHNDKNKTWILDIDNDDVLGKVIDVEYIDGLIEYISHLEPVGNKVVKQLPTKNGHHLVTKPFDSRTLYTKYPALDVHKDNPINLYIP